MFWTGENDGVIFGIIVIFFISSAYEQFIKGNWSSFMVDLKLLFSCLSFFFVLDWRK